MKRKLLLSLLVLSMVLCLLPVGASADGIVGKQWNTVSAGPFHAAAIDANGGLWTWGSNPAGQLGNGGTGDIDDGYGMIYQSTPAKIMDDVVSVSTNSLIGGMVSNMFGATAAIKSDGSLWVWGHAGLIGTGGKGNATVDNAGRQDAIQNVPIKLMDDVASVSMGSDYSLALKTDGTLFAWSWEDTPVKIMDNVISISGGGSCLAAIKNDNSLWVWDNYGSEDIEENITMEKVMDDVSAVSAGYSVTTITPQPVFAAIKTDGSLWMWGYLGIPALYNLKEPMKVMDNVLSVSADGNTVVAIKSDNSLWEIISKFEGVPNEDYITTGVDGWSTATKKIMDGVSEVSCGMDYTVAKKIDGSVWAWGYNDSYCVGNGGKTDSTDQNNYPIQETPVQIIAGGTTPPVDQPTVIETGGVNPQASGQSYANTQTVKVNGDPVTFETYALKDENGYPTNYIKLRDLAYTVNDTKAQFDIVWDGKISLTKGRTYKTDGSEMHTPFSGDRVYNKGPETLTIDGKPYTVQCFMLFDDNGGGYTYYKLRDLGMALGFNVGWNAADGVFIETDKPYAG